jgi:hypothetical protein
MEMKRDVTINSFHLLFFCQSIGYKRVQFQSQLRCISRFSSRERAAERSPKWAGHTTAKQHCPIKISKECVLTQLINASASNTAQSLRRVFRAKLRNEILRIRRDVGAERLVKGRNSDEFKLLYKSSHVNRKEYTTK